MSVKMHGKDTPEETNKRDDKVIDISKMTLEPDGKTAKIVYEDKPHVKKQPKRGFRTGGRKR